MSNSRRTTDFSFSEADKQILKKQIIDENSPGTILRDFNCLLHYIDSTSMEATKKNYHFPLKYLELINERFTHPIKLELNRPQQKSFPNINGLYLILRNIGIVNFKSSGKKHIFVLDKAVHQSWNSLNPTERYFTLLEAWLLRGEPREILGEDHAIYKSLMRTCFDFWKRIPARGLQIEGDSEEEFMTKYAYGFYNIALLELFGLLEIQHGQPEIGKGWRILRANHTNFGDAIFNYLLQVDKEEDYFWYYDSKSEIPIGKWQSYFQPFFPEWHNNLSIPGTEFREGIYLFKVSLGRVWRRIEIQSDMTWEDLTIIILEAFEFDHDHLYSYYYKNRFGITAEINSPNLDEGPYTTEQRIGEIPIQIGSSMKFLYDFGDNWEFEVILEKITQFRKKLIFPRIIEEHGEPPVQYPVWDDDEW